jgi:RNA polymerase sigma-70 factor (ECF subfamily)
MTRLTEQQALLDAARDGSRDALGELLQAYRPLLLMLAREELSPRLRSKGGASDLVQNTYVDALSDFNDFSGHTPAEFRHWLEQIVRHNVCDYGRHFRDTCKREAGREQLLPPDFLVRPRDKTRSESASPLAELLQEERAEVLEQALGRLSDEDQAVIVLRQRERLPFEQVARRLGCTAAAVRQRWVRAMEHWRRLVEQAYGPP